jgi:hypothetical protein
MEWQDLVGRRIVAVAPTRAGRPNGTIPNVVHIRFEDGSAAILSCDWASHERPWLGLEGEDAADDPWLNGEETPDAASELLFSAAPPPPDDV